MLNVIKNIIIFLKKKKMIRNNYIHITIPYAKKDIAKSIPGARWNPGPRQWMFPLTNKDLLYTRFPEYRASIERDIEALKQAGRQASEYREKALEWAEIPADYNFKLKPFPHQEEAIRRGLAFPQYAFLMEMGTGKTKSIIDLACIMALQDKISGCLIICPKTIIPSWEEEIKKNCGKNCEILSKKHLTKNCFFGIINYEQIITIKDNEIWKQYSMVVLDESSKIKNPKAQRSKDIVKFFKDTKYKYILSGTPVSQNPTDIYQQFKFLNDKFLGFTSYYTFRNYYCTMGGYGNYQIIGYKDLPGLKAKIKAHSYQLKKEDCITLPEKIYEQRHIDMTPELRRQYKDMKDNLILEIEGGDNITANIVLTKILRLQQIAAGCHIDNKYNNKLKELIDIIEDNSESSIIIWARFIPTIKMLEQVMKDKNIPYSILYGEIEDRAREIRLFQEGKTRVFIGQIATGGFGITLTRASIAVYYENTFSMEERLQSEARCHRIGQKNNVVYIDLLYKNSIDSHVLQAIKHKQDTAKYLVNSFLGGKYDNSRRDEKKSDR